MANSVGSLVVSLGLNAAEYVQGWTKAEYQARKSLDEIKSTVAKVAGALGVGIGVHAFAEMITGAIEAEARLEELGKRAGISGEQLSSLSRAARLSHTDLETVANLSAKLSKTLLESQDSGSKAEAVLRSLGFTSADTARLLANPAQALFEMAKQLDKLPEGGTKSAASLFLLGKGGAAVSAMLGELAKQNALVATRTNEEIAAAKEFADKLSDMEARSSKLKTTLANALVPTLDDVLTVLTKVTTGSGGTQAALAELAKSGSIKEFSQDAVIALATVVEALLVIGRVARGIPDEFRLIASDVDILLKATNAPKFKPFGALGFSPEEAAKGNADFDAAVKERERILARMKKDQEDFEKYNPSFLTDALKGQFAEGKGPPGAAQGNLFSDRSFQAQQTKKQADAEALEKRLRLAVGAAGKGGGEDQTVKRLLDQQVKAQEDAIRDEQDILNSRERFLQTYYQDDLISLDAYYSGKRNAADEALKNTLAAYDKEIAAIKAFANNPATKAADKIKAETDLAGVIEKRGRTQRDADLAGYQSTLDKDRALRQYADSVAEVNAAILAMTGNERAAAEIRFDLQNRSLLAKATNSGDAATVANIERMKAQVLAQTDLNKAATAYQTTLDSLSVAQGRIALAEASGSITSLEAIRQRATLATQYVDSLRKQADEQERLARTLVGPEQDQAIAKLQRLRLEIDLLAESAHELENTFRHTFVDAFASDLTDAVTGTKSLSEAVRDMERQIVASITRIASQNIGEAIFGKSGPGGFLPAGLASIFGGGIGGFGGGGPQQLSGPSDGFLDGILGSIGSFFTGLGFAGGGQPPIGKASWVGEHGRELFVPKTAGTIIPNDLVRSGGTRQASNVTIHVNVLPGASRETVEQARLKLGLEVQNAMNAIG